MERYKGISSNSKSVSCSRSLKAAKQEEKPQRPEAEEARQALYSKMHPGEKSFRKLFVAFCLVVVSYLVGIAAHFSRLERKGGFPDRSSRERDKVFLPFGLPRPSPLYGAFMETPVEEKKALPFHCKQDWI